MSFMALEAVLFYGLMLAGVFRQGLSHLSMALQTEAIPLSAQIRGGLRGMGVMALHAHSIFDRLMLAFAGSCYHCAVTPGTYG